MNKHDKQVIESQLEDEKAVLKDLERQYKRALHDINERIKILQSDDSPSRAYQADYQKTLKAQVEAILEKLHADEYDSIHKYLSNSYTSGYVGTMYAMGRQSGIHVITPLDQKAAVKAIVTDSKLSTDLYGALGYDMDKLKKHVREEITRGIATSLPYEQIARNISGYTSMPLSNANRIVRTEGHRIQQASANDARNAAKAKGADVVKQWDASLDGATRKLHRELDGQIREVDEPFEAGGKKVMYPGKFGDPAQDCNCRCVALTRARWALDEKELRTLKERAKFFDLDKTKDFEEYKEKYLKAAKSSINPVSASNPIGKLLPKSKPVRPKAMDFDDPDALESARKKYRKEKEEYLEQIKKWIDAQLPETAMDKKELGQWCKENGLQLVNVDGMDMRALNAYTKRYGQLIKDYPLGDTLYYSTGDILKRRDELEFVDDTSFFAEASHGIRFGRTFEDYERTLFNFADKMIDGTNVRGDGTINTLFDHEFGHSLQDSIVYSKGFSGRMRTEMDRDLFQSCMGKEGMSEYAKTNMNEMFAEGFAAYYGGEQTEFAKAFGEFLGRWLH